MKRFLWFLVAIVAAGTGVGARADFFPKETLMKAERERTEPGGHGKLRGEYAFTRDKAPKDHAIKEISWLRLDPGDAVGFHAHTTNEDAYIIVSGTGTFKDKDGQDKPVKAGDIMIVRKGESHGIANTGKEPLVFLDVIAEQ